MKNTFSIVFVVLLLGGCQLFLPNGEEDGTGGHRSSTTTSVGEMGGGGPTTSSATSDGGAGPTSSTHTSSTGEEETVSTGSGESSSESSTNASSSASSSTGGEPLVDCTIRWQAPDHTAGMYLGVGGIINRPVGADIVSTPFPGAGCMAASTDSNDVMCHVLGPLPTGTYLQLNLYNYSDALGAQKQNSRCDQPGFPSSDCPGTVTVKCDNISVVAPYVSNGTDAPAAPWSTTVVNNYLEIAVTVP
ncbi:MAG: hypothetical protein ABIO72_05380 [Patescibacteria group bacterium]